VNIWVIEVNGNSVIGAEPFNHGRTARGTAGV
jgi:hypothetical protein